MPAYAPYMSNSLVPNMQLLLPRGFSVNLVLLIWGLFGGVLLHGFMALWRDMLLRTKMDQPVKTAQEVLDRGLIPVTHWGDQYIMDFLSQSPNPADQQLAKITVVPNDYLEWRTILENDVQGAGTHVYIYGWIVDYSDESKFGKYYFSKEVLQGLTPWMVWIVNKKWPLHDELAKHVLLYQQVRGAFEIKLKRKT